MFKVNNKDVRLNFVLSYYQEEASVSFYIGFICQLWINSHIILDPQQTSTFSKLIIKLLEESVKGQYDNKVTRARLMTFSGVFIVSFAQISHIFLSVSIIDIRDLFINWTWTSSILPVVVRGVLWNGWCLKNNFLK